MTDTRFIDFDLPDGRFIEASIVIESYGCGPTMPSWNYAGDPGEPPEWYVKTIDINGERVPDRVYKSWWSALKSELTMSDPTTTNPEFQTLSDAVDSWLCDNYDFEPPEPWYDEDY